MEKQRFNQVLELCTYRMITRELFDQSLITDDEAMAIWQKIADMEMELIKAKKSLTHSPRRVIDGVGEQKVAICE